MRLSEFRSLSFDCYGTLIDWEAGIVAALRPWLDRNGANVAKDDILDAFGRAESAQQAATPGLLYPDILKHVHDRLADAWRLPRDADAAAAFGASVGDWPAFPRHAAGPHLPQAALQADHPVQHRPRLVRRVER